MDVETSIRSVPLDDACRTDPWNDRCTTL